MLLSLPVRLSAGNGGIDGGYDVGLDALRQCVPYVGQALQIEAKIAGIAPNCTGFCTARIGSIL